MSYPQITLGGIAIGLEAGPSEQSVERIGGSVLVRMSDGAGVKMTHWGRVSGAVRGSGLLPAGLDGLDYSQPLELLLTKPRSLVGAGASFTLDAECRPDREPWAQAMVDNRWRPTGCVRTGLVVDVTPVSGAARYMVMWMPRYQVFASEPVTGMGASHDWSFSWEQI